MLSVTVSPHFGVDLSPESHQKPNRCHQIVCTLLVVLQQLLLDNGPKSSNLLAIQMTLFGFNWWGAHWIAFWSDFFDPFLQCGLWWAQMAAGFTERTLHGEGFVSKIKFLVRVHTPNSVCQEGFVLTIGIEMHQHSVWSDCQRKMVSMRFVCDKHCLFSASGIQLPGTQDQHSHWTFEIH